MPGAASILALAPANSQCIWGGSVSFSVTEDEVRVSVLGGGIMVRRDAG